MCGSCVEFGEMGEHTLIGHRDARSGPRAYAPLRILRCAHGPIARGGTESDGWMGHDSRPTCGVGRAARASGRGGNLGTICTRREEPHHMPRARNCACSRDDVLFNWWHGGDEGRATCGVRLASPLPPLACGRARRRSEPASCASDDGRAGGWRAGHWSRTLGTRLGPCQEWPATIFAQRSVKLGVRGEPDWREGRGGG